MGNAAGSCCALVFLGIVRDCHATHCIPDFLQLRAEDSTGLPSNA